MTRSTELVKDELLVRLRPHSTRRTNWKLVVNPGWQPEFPTSFQLVANNFSTFLGVANKLAT